MGQGSIKQNLIQLDVKESPVGLAPVFKLDWPPYCYVQRIQIPQHLQASESKRLNCFKEINSSSVIEIFAVEREEGLLSCQTGGLAAYCLYLPLSLRQWLSLYNQRLQPHKLAHLMSRLLSLGIELAMVGRCQLIEPAQISLDQLYVDVTGEIRIHPFASNAREKDALPEVEGLGVFQIRRQREITAEGLVWRAGMLALQVGCRLPSQLMFYDPSQNEINFSQIYLKLQQFGTLYPEPISKLLNKMVKRTNRILLSRCHEAWTTIDNSFKLTDSSLVLFQENEVMSDQFVKAKTSYNSPLKKILLTNR